MILHLQLWMPKVKVKDKPELLSAISKFYQIQNAIEAIDAINRPSFRYVGIASRIVLSISLLFLQSRPSCCMLSV
jgi:hypothetical protein